MTAGKELAGRVALVTGAARNIGRAIAIALAEAGATVAVNARTAKADADAVVAEIRAAGGKADTCIADIADAGAVNTMVADIVKRHGKVDILILNASIRKETAFIDMSFEEWRSLLSITLDGSFHCTKACLPSMIAAGGGSIVTLGGMTALSGAKRRVHGSVGKHGLWGMTRALAKELGEHQINVNCVAPGQMDTARAAGRSERAPVTNVPMGRRSQPEEVASMVRYLCTPAAAMVSGQLIYVDGGQQMF
ncbi:MAG: SDR family oxidoreductase [Betaproteobacteria bacterium]|jgi:3-oxoacyl-[acyl-carrier protein] reductase|nr:SDR family oxidoreductase [Betaproteobacteria bacterium]MDH4294480.1 SDR family oxidoreductase [Betaproteobacteria bacterium]MDH5341792.1 SDR family oxidoreductase [Betaproteobacteria bacterium]